MRLLFVGFAHSLHLARYLSMFDGAEWDVHLFDSNLRSTEHPGLPGVTHHLAPPMQGSDVPVEAGPSGLFEARVQHLLRVFDEVKPDLVHSGEIQHAGALVDEVRRRRSLGAPWVVMSWGSDMFWSGRISTHVPRLRSVLGACDYFSAECHRDIGLARSFGFRGRVLGTWPVSGGIDLDHASTLRSSVPPSQRRSLSVKLWTSANGMGAVALDAIERCSDLLAGWELSAHTISPELVERARSVAHRARMAYAPMSVQGEGATHDAMLAMHGRARVSLSLNRSDGLTHVLTEAMTMGAFPIVSTGSCGCEVADADRGAAFVPATDADAVASALRRALTDDQLVDAAAVLNARVIEEHFDLPAVKARVLGAYEEVVATFGHRDPASAAPGAVLTSLQALGAPDADGATMLRRELLRRIYLDDDPAPEGFALVSLLGDGADEATRRVLADLEWTLERQRDTLAAERKRWADGEVEPEDALESDPGEELLEVRAWADRAMTRLLEQQEEIERLHQVVVERDTEIDRLHQLVVERDDEIQRLGDVVRDLDAARRAGTEDDQPPR